MPHATVEKTTVRQLVRTSRATRSLTERSVLAQDLTVQLIALTESYSVSSVACYVSHEYEPATVSYLRWAHQHNIRVLLPISRPDHTLDWAPYASADEHSTDTAEPSFAPGLYGIPEPIGPTVPFSEVAEVDLLLIPACAVDRHGIRMGWGKGYYDRFLSRFAQRPPTYAVVYDDEVMATLPHDDHDQPVHGAVTPSRVICFDPPPIFQRRV